MPYPKPKQVRAVVTEQKFLDAFEACLAQKSFGATTLDEIAEAAGLNRGAFLRRFGSKKAALMALYKRFCDEAVQELAQIAVNMYRWPLLESACEETSQRLEYLQNKHFAANRAMHELYVESLSAEPQTKEIFLATVALMRAFQQHYLPGQPCTEAGAFAAPQLLVTVTYNYVLKAMPALPREERERHRMIAHWMAWALRFA
jgi:AcrR family transcriptional regulator